MGIGTRIDDRSLRASDTVFFSFGAPVDGESGTPVIERATHTRGEEAERLVVERLRAVLSPEVALLHHVRWLLRDRGHVREGEADIVIGDPDRGILVVEVKSGEVSRDANGTWWGIQDAASRR